MERLEREHWFVIITVVSSFLTLLCSIWMYKQLDDYIWGDVLEATMVISIGVMLASLLLTMMEYQKKKWKMYQDEIDRLKKD